MRYTGTCIGGPGAGQVVTGPSDTLMLDNPPDFSRPGAAMVQMQEVGWVYYRHHELHWRNEDTGATTLMGLWIPVDKDVPWAVAQMLEAYTKLQDPNVAGFVRRMSK